MGKLEKRGAKGTIIIYHLSRPPQAHMLPFRKFRSPYPCLEFWDVLAFPFALGAQVLHRGA